MPVDPGPALTRRYNDPDHPEWETEFADVCSKRECTCDAVEEQAVGAENVSVTFGHFINNNASYPAQCKAGHFNQFMYYEPKGIPLGRATTTTEGGCCELCGKFDKLCKGYGYTYSSSKCQLYTLILGFNPASIPLAPHTPHPPHPLFSETGSSQTMPACGVAKLAKSRRPPPSTGLVVLASRLMCHVPRDHAVAIQVKGGSLGFIDTSGTNFTRELSKQTAVGRRASLAAFGAQWGADHRSPVFVCAPSAGQHALGVVVGGGQWSVVASKHASPQTQEESPTPAATF